MKYIKDYENLDQKKVLLRLDLNVPLKNGIITDQTRIDKILPIINFLLSKNSRIIVVSHVGRPKGEKKNDLSMIIISANQKSYMDAPLNALRIVLMISAIHIHTAQPILKT